MEKYFLTRNDRGMLSSGFSDLSKNKSKYSLSDLLLRTRLQFSVGRDEVNCTLSTTAETRLRLVACWQKLPPHIVKQRGEAAGWVGRSPPTDTPRVSGRPPARLTTGAQCAKRLQEGANLIVHFTALIAEPFIRMHARFLIKCEWRLVCKLK